MNVFLIRHAKALSVGDDGIETDEERRLTSVGEEQATLLGQALQSRNVEFDLVLSTPLVRARQTAELMLNAYGKKKPELQIVEELTPPCKPRKMGRVLKDLHKTNVAIVGHQPDLSNWASWFLGSKKTYIDFTKGSAACLYWESELSKGGGALVWMLTPLWYMPNPEKPAKASKSKNG